MKSANICVRVVKGLACSSPASLNKPSLFVIALCALAICTSPLVAEMTVRLNDYGNLRRGSGGEFTFLLPENNGWSQSPLDYYNSAGLDNGGFQTFCLESNEHLWQNTTYIAELSLQAKNGGTTIGFDNISKGTGWLYEQFVGGTLEGYVYDNPLDRTYSAESLQKAFWFLEDESMGEHNEFVTLAVGNFSNGLNEAKSDYTELDGNVRVMTLTKMDGSIVQDQLILAPQLVPVPGALMLGIFGIFLVRQKNIKRLI